MICVILHKLLRLVVGVNFSVVDFLWFLCDFVELEYSVSAHGSLHSTYFHLALNHARTLESDNENSLHLTFVTRSQWHAFRNCFLCSWDKLLCCSGPDPSMESERQWLCDGRLSASGPSQDHLCGRSPSTSTRRWGFRFSLDTSPYSAPQIFANILCFHKLKWAASLVSKLFGCM